MLADVDFRRSVIYCAHVFDAIIFYIDNVQIEGLNVKLSYVCLRLPHTSAIQSHYALAHY